MNELSREPNDTEMKRKKSTVKKEDKQGNQQNTPMPEERAIDFCTVQRNIFHE